MQYLDAVSKKRMISVCFQGKSFSTTGIQVYNAEEAEVEWFYEDLHDLLELTHTHTHTHTHDVLFTTGDLMQK